MLLIVLLVIIFWVIVPGLLTGWMLREHGRSFAWGLVPGALLGPLGILLTLGFVYATDRRPRGRHAGHAHGFRPFYNFPFVGRLHVSTAWSLAGVVAFLCAWMIGGLGYEFYTARQRLAEEAAGGRVAQAGPGRTQTGTPGNVAANQLQPAQKPSAAAQNSTARPPEGPLLSDLATQSGQSAQVGGGRPGDLPAQPRQTPTTAATGLGLVAAAPQPPSEAAPAAPSAPSPETLPPPPAPSREAAVGEVTRSLGAGGHRVHAAVSGDAQTATLSVSGSTLTRQAATQLLGNGRTRQALKGAGIRIVVFVNGEESWTYIL
jgi:hypothetical protein